VSLDKDRHSLHDRQRTSFFFHSLELAINRQELSSLMISGLSHFWQRLSRGIHDELRSAQLQVEVGSRDRGNRPIETGAVRFVASSCLCFTFMISDTQMHTFSGMISFQSLQSLQLTRAHATRQRGELKD